MRVRREALGVDFYAWSNYKAFGPHAAALYGTSAAWEQLRECGPNHRCAAAAAAAGSADHAPTTTTTTTATTP